jgi:hypothetical protein
MFESVTPVEAFDLIAEEIHLSETAAVAAG